MARAAANKSAGIVQALDLLEGERPGTLPPTVVLFGPQRYLTGLVLRHLIGTGDGPGDLFAVELDSDGTEWAVVADQLHSGSLFGDDNKVVVLRDADDFVKKHRERLEEVASDAGRAVPLLLTVEAWPANTRLYRIVGEHGLQVSCNVPMTGTGKWDGPDTARVGKWLAGRAARTHGFQIAPDAARLVFELCDGEMGRADQELARLGLYVSEKETIDRARVQSLVGGWRSQTMFEAIDAAVEGQAAVALQLIDRLIQSGEHPLALFGQLAWSLRRYSQALRILDRNQSGGKGALAAALKQAGFSGFRGDLERAEPRMRRLGRARVSRLAAVLREIDRSLKGSHSRDDRGRLMLEKLVFWLA